LTGPIVGCSRYCQAVAIATISDTTGRKKAARKKARPRIRPSTSSASANPARIDAGVTMATKNAVLRTDVAKPLSPSSSTKFASPTKRSDPKPSS
jgi:hypothetical protein